MIGRRVSHYAILEELGSGGMGVVYKARDEKLDRLVAIKFLPTRGEEAEQERTRFVHEARAASALEHKNVCTIHEIDESPDGRTFIVMAYYEGESLAQRLGRGPLTVDQAIRVAGQVAEGLAAAHRRAIVHRDIKPGNVMLASDGQAKIVDFGVAKLAGATRLTRTGGTLGTVAYMAPEQARGDDVDPRADVFSLGALLYEMVTGRPPFQGDHEAAVLYGVLHREPDLAALPADVPDALAHTIADCLSKDPARRPPAEEVASRLGALADARRVPASARRSPGIAEILRRPALAVPLALALLGVGLWAYRAIERRADVRWVRQEALPRIAGLLEQGRHADAFRLVREAQAVVPHDPTVRELELAATVPMTVVTEPAGARVSYRPYLDAEAAWVELGTTPVRELRVPADYLRFRLELEGHQTREMGASTWYGRLNATLIPESEAIPGMVRIPAGQFAQPRGEPIDVAAFWIDRDEVSNADYQAFVDQGGYRDPTHWPEDLVRDYGSFEEGVANFVDATGRPGPSTWRVGSHEEGRGSYPVGGVSWYEAAAYCAFREKRLPTLHQWKLATGSQTDIGSLVVVASNFAGAGPVPVGSTQGVGGHGTHDMAGNVAEWTWTEGRQGTRYSLGGGWVDPEYIYTELPARPPGDRPAHQGLRCARHDAAPDDPLLAPLANPVYDFSQRRIVDDATFRQWEAFHGYDPRPLEARVDTLVPGIHRFDRQTVSFAAAYGDERVVAHVFLPRGVAPPYQAVVYFPGSVAFQLRSSEALPEMSLVEFVPRSGRALVYPVYAGSYERAFPAPSRGPAERRARAIKQAQDLMRTVDYLVERDDIDADRLGFMGLSAGGEYGAVYMALERRLRAAVFIGGGYDPTHMQHEEPFEQPWNYAPRVTAPVLMLNGNRDYAIPLQAQRQLLNDLGTPAEHKRHVVFDGGHIPRHDEIAREALDWFDRYLGPVHRDPGTGG